MTYTLRLWVRGRVQETLTSPDPDVTDTRFREIATVWPTVWPHIAWSVQVVASPTGDAWPSTVAERSYTVASYQHAPRRAAA